MPERTADAKPRGRRRPRPAVLLAIAALLNAGAGIALGIAVTPDDPSPPPPAPAPPEAIATGDLRVVLPAGWRKLDQAPDVPGVSVDGAAAARGPSADVVLAMLPPESATLLPPA